MKRLTRLLNGLLIFLLLALFSVSTAKASHIVGSDITYKCTTTPGVFEISLVIYRKCDGGAATLCPSTCGAACSQIMNINGADASCAAQSYGSFNVSLVSVRDVNFNPECPTSKNTCTNMNCVTPGTYTPAIERYEFTGYANIGTTSGIPASCCNVRFSWELCCRNAEIGTGAASQNFYVDAVINRCLSISPCNSSPLITNDPYMIMCGGENVYFNNGVTDPDSDSLSFAFAPALRGFNNSVTYLLPFSAQTPMPWAGMPNAPFPGGIRCDTLTGDISFTPGNATGANFYGVMAIEIKQWKYVSGVPTIIGTTRRDIQMVVLANCIPNNSPKLATVPMNTIDPTLPKTSWEVCAGSQLCFNVTAKDTDFSLPLVSDTTYLSWNRALASLGATFVPTYTIAQRKLPAPIGGPREDVYQFCWTPTLAMARSNPYYFTVSAKDSRCPNPGKVGCAFSIKVLGTAGTSLTKTAKQCGKWQIGYSSGQTFTSTQIQVAQQPFDYTFASGSTTYSNVINTPDIAFTKPGKYLLKLTVQQNACTTNFIDTLLVDTPMSILLRDTFTCSGSPITVGAIGLKGTSPYQYRWYNSIRDTALIPLNSPNFSVANYSVAPVSTKRYTIELRDSLGCRKYDSLEVSVSNSIKNVITIPVVCFGKSTGSMKVELKDTTKTPLFKLNNGPFQSGNIFSGLTAGTYSVTVKDSGNCNSIQNNIPILQPSMLKDTLSTVSSETCFNLNNGVIITQAIGGTAPYRFSLDSTAFFRPGNFNNLIPKTYTIYVRDTNNCTVSFSKTVAAADSLYATLTTKNQTCFATTDGEIKVSAKGGKKPYSYKLNSGLFVNDSLFKNLSASLFTISVKDSNACLISITDSIRKPTLLQQTIQLSPVSCFGGADGKMMISVSGGIKPYRFSTDSVNYDTVSQRMNLTAKSYNLSIKDSVGCINKTSQIITQPTQIVSSNAVKNVSCYNGADGKITITASGGNPPYLYQIDSGMIYNSGIIDSLKAKTHTIKITDATGCLQTIQQSISQPSQLIGAIVTTPPTCANRADATLEIIASYATPPYVYNIDSSSFGLQRKFTNLVAKSYVIGIKDSNNCETYINGTIINPSPIAAGPVIGLSSVTKNSVHSYSVVNQGGLNYKWTVSKGTITSGMNTSAATIHWDSVGTDTLWVSVNQDSTCGDTALLQIQIGNVGLAEIAAQIGLSIYPNPTKNNLHISVTSIPENKFIYLYDLQGKLKLHQELLLNQQLNLQELATGMYFLEIGDWRGKIVKE